MRLFKSHLQALCDEGEGEEEEEEEEQEEEGPGMICDEQVRLVDS